MIIKHSNKKKRTIKQVKSIIFGLKGEINVVENNDYKDLEIVRDSLLEVATITDELIALGKREDDGEDVEKELEILMGRYMMKYIELSSLEKMM